MDRTVSVVVPVYNTAPFLDQCIQSILAQTYPHLEILLINDGSTDRSPEICQNWAARDSRIRLIHTPNRGLGMARNTGMDAATGSYICFCDSDDCIAPDTVEKALTAALAHRAQVVVFGLTALDTRGRVLETVIPRPEATVYRGREVCSRFLPELIGPDPETGRDSRLYMSACVMLFSLSALRGWNWRFVSEREIISEDVYSLLALFGRVQAVALLPEALYFYRTNPNSLSRSYRPDRYSQIRHFYLASLDLCRRMDCPQEIPRRLTDLYLRFTVAAIKQEAALRCPPAHRLKAIAAILRDDILQQALQTPRVIQGYRPRQWMLRAMAARRSRICLLLALAKNTADRIRHRT